MANPCVTTSARVRACQPAFSHVSLRVCVHGCMLASLLACVPPCLLACVCALQMSSSLALVKPGCREAANFRVRHT
eukprot:5467198-Alexandrium_andersonii.AAC.1